MSDFEAGAAINEVSDVVNESVVEAKPFDASEKIPSNAERLAYLLVTLRFTELLDAKKLIEDRIAEVAQQEKMLLLESAAVVARYFNTTPDALFPVGKAKKATKKVTLDIKFRDPSDPTKTWSGRGKRPSWVTDDMKV